MAEAFLDTSCILAWLIEEGYDVYAFMADIGQEEVICDPNQRRALIIFHKGLRVCSQESPCCRSKEVLPRGLPG